MLKSGIKTSELWALVAAVLNAETNALNSDTHVNLATVAAAAVYALCRTILKLGGQK